MAKVNKGPGVRQGMLCAVLPEAVMVKLESCGLELEKKKNGAMLMMRLQAVQKDEARLKVVITCRAR